MVRRELLRETLEQPQLRLVPHIGYVSLFPFMMGIIPAVSQINSLHSTSFMHFDFIWCKLALVRPFYSNKAKRVQEKQRHSRRVKTERK